MNELAKIRRVVEREAVGWECRTCRARRHHRPERAHAGAEFLRVASVDGVLLAKLDGTAKGDGGGDRPRAAASGSLPRVGEKPEDLVDFRPRDFAAALLE